MYNIQQRGVEILAEEKAIYIYIRDYLYFGWEELIL
jgi:hypothetical protein